METPPDAAIGPPAQELIPPRPSLKALREAAVGCRACPLWRSGTQTVFGRGPKKASLMLVGEQPGDREDREGEPFVGPAGRVLDAALERAGIGRGDVYVTNAVKHFKWKPGSGKRRIHQKPGAMESAACRPWLEAELGVVAPSVVVCLGATAAQSLLGKDFRVTRDRGRFFDLESGPRATGTIHPSALLRIRDRHEREEGEAGLARDLERAHAELS